MVSYVLVEEANDLVSKTLTSDEISKSGWVELSDSDKLIWLNRATAFIDSLPYRGKKANKMQTNKFPRVVNTLEIGIPNAVKTCTAHLAYLLLLDSKSARREMQKTGVKSITASKVSESYNEDTSFKALNKETVDSYLSPYLVKGHIR